MQKQDQQETLPSELEVQDGEQSTSVPSLTKRRRMFLIVALTLLVIVATVAIAVPVALVKSTSDSKPQTNSTTKPGEWSSCTVTCGNGTRKRTRACSLSSCNVTMETSPCQLPPCKESASWQQWGQWSPCSKPCGKGMQSRNRNCSNEKESGSLCYGVKRETRNCNLAVCEKKDCSDLLRYGKTANGIYKVDPDGRGLFNVYCDMTTDGGGWTVFQRRKDGSVDFYRNWTEYKTGFGNLLREFWLGNEKIHRLTSSRNITLLVLIGDWNGKVYHAKYQVFRVGSEKINYTLKVDSYSGNATDSMAYHDGMMFTTKDRDNDEETASNCAIAYHGGWWYTFCVKANLNGKYVGDTIDQKGIVWFSLTAPAFRSMETSEMMLRPGITET